jgi:hypothetical protein
MKFIKASLWVLVCLVSIIGVLYLWVRPPRSHPITLSFLGYGPLSNGLPVGLFVMSNSSKRSIEYFGDGSVNPYYHYTRPLTNFGPNVHAITNYHQLPSVYGTQLTLPPKGSITFPVLMTAGTTDVTVSICYLRPPGAIRKTVRGIQSSLSGRWSEEYQNVDLKAPFK